MKKENINLLNVKIYRRKSVIIMASDFNASIKLVDSLSGHIPLNLLIPHNISTQKGFMLYDDYFTAIKSVNSDINIQPHQLKKLNKNFVKNLVKKQNDDKILKKITKNSLLGKKTMLVPSIKTPLTSNKNLKRSKNRIENKELSSVSFNTITFETEEDQIEKNKKKGQNRVAVIKKSLKNIDRKKRVGVKSALESSSREDIWKDAITKSKGLRTKPDEKILKKKLKRIEHKHKKAKKPTFQKKNTFPKKTSNTLKPKNSK